MNNPAMLQRRVVIQVEKSSSLFGEVSNRMTEINAITRARIKTMSAPFLKSWIRTFLIAYPSTVPIEDVWYLVPSNSCSKPFAVAPLAQKQAAIPPKKSKFLNILIIFSIVYLVSGVVELSFLVSSESLLIQSRASISMSTYCFLRPYIFREYSFMIFAARSFL